MIRSSTYYFFSLYIINCCLFQFIMPIDNHHFYRASNFFYIFNETRLTRQGLTSFDATIGSGYTNNAHRNCFSRQKCRCKKNKTKKKFSLTEANFFYTKNLTRGFFLQAHCPVRHMKIKTYSSPNHERYNPCNQTGIGDTSLLTGWAFSYTKTEFIDFIDITCSTGILIPTGKTTHINKTCAIPLGYNGHVGIPISCNYALGALEWITIGMHTGVLFFFDTQHSNTRTHHGPIWDITTYFKADHVIKGLSLLFGYTFAQQEPNRAHMPYHLSHSTPYTKISSSPYDHWNMHTIHFIAEYDFTPNNASFGPRAGIFYNKQCGGKHIFKTNMNGGNVGLEISLHF